MDKSGDSVSKASAGFTPGRLSAEDADRLASMFRPSWDLDEAPFVGPGTLAEGELRALSGGGVRPDVRAAAATALGAGGHEGASAGHEPENSVIIDRSITADGLGASHGQRAAMGKTMVGGMKAPPAQAAQAAPQEEPPRSSRPSQRPAAPAFDIKPPSVRPRRAAPVHECTASETKGGMVQTVCSFYRR